LPKQQQVKNCFTPARREEKFTEQVGLLSSTSADFSWFHEIVSQNSRRNCRNLKCRTRVVCIILYVCETKRFGEYLDLRDRNVQGGWRKMVPFFWDITQLLYVIGSQRREYSAFLEIKDP
jgi:hypothetical protein